MGGVLGVAVCRGPFRNAGFVLCGNGKRPFEFESSVQPAASLGGPLVRSLSALASVALTVTANAGSDAKSTVSDSGDCSGSDNACAFMR